MEYRRTWSLILMTLPVILVTGSSVRTKRETASLEPGNWDSCKEGVEAPPTRVITNDRVAGLRMYFATSYIQAYIVPNGDAHQSEYPSNYDKRRGYISGFQGSAGTAVITLTKAALWTDGRYFLEAEDTLDCNWILMRSGENDVPTMIEWLKKELRPGDRVGASPFLISNAQWKRYSEELGKKNIVMQPVTNELVDIIWNSQLRPPQPNTDINVLPMDFAGRSWQDKVTDMRNEMEEQEADMLVITGLDETAWLFNLRATDIAYNPFFISYAIIDNSTVRLYILDHLTKIAKDPSDPASTRTVAEHLNTDSASGSCSGRMGMCVHVLPYNASGILEDVRTMSQGVAKVWLPASCSRAVYSSIGEEDKIYQANTPAATSKTQKNPTEVAGMKNSHIRDAVALISFAAKLEKEVKEGKEWTELSASNELEKYRRRQQYNRGFSFASISSSGSNGAIIHYRPSEATDKQITKDKMYLLDSGGQYLQQANNRGLSFTSISGSGSNGAIIHYSVSNETDTPITTSDMYLLDSGGQYLDGTTDVTRTFHFGTPSAYEKECYTRVLMGHINLFQAVWPKGLYGRDIDAFARAALWDVGLVYRHGTGHGIGMYLSVHEGPAYISKSSYPPEDIPYMLQENQFISDEPGYYQDGQFGIRLENIVRVVNATTKYSFPGTQFLTFEHITLVPYEPNLINYDMLNDKQLDYLNTYHRLCREKVGPELQKQQQTAGYDWLLQKSAVVVRTGKTTAGTATQTFNLLCLISCVLFCLML